MCNVFSLTLSLLLKLILIVQLAVNGSEGLDIAILTISASGGFSLPENTEGFWVVRNIKQPPQELGRGKIRFPQNSQRWNMRSISVEYNFNEHENLQYAVYMKNGDTETEIGVLECGLGSIIRGKYQGKIGLKVKGVDMGYLQISGRIIAPKAIKVSLLNNSEYLGFWGDIADPCVKILREESPGKYIQEFKHIIKGITETIKLENAFKFPLFESVLGKSGKTKIKCEVWSYRKNAYDRFIGFLEFTLADVINGSNEGGVSLTFNNSQNESQKQVNMLCKIKGSANNFWDLIHKTIQFRFGFAFQCAKLDRIIKFLANAEETKIIRAVAQMVQDHSDVTDFPTIVFGINDGESIGENVIALNGNFACNSIEDAVKAHNDAISKSASDSCWDQSSGIYDALNQLAQIASTKDSNEMDYFVFLVLVDHDWKYGANIATFIESIQLHPMSIFILGIETKSFWKGNKFENFKNLSSNISATTRKFIQFFSWDEIFKLKSCDETIEDVLARQLLSAVPHQFLEWKEASELQQLNVVPVLAAAISE